MSRVAVNISDQLEAGVPDTGFLGITGDGGTILGVAALIGVAILILVGAILWWKKRGGFKIGWSGRKAVGAVAGVFVIAAVLVGVLNFVEGGDEEANAASTEDRLSVSAEDVTMNVVLKDEPVYTMIENIVTVNDATGGGYTLMAYIDGDSDILTGESREIESVSEGGLGKLGENTWGIATSLPDSQESETWQGLPKGIDNALTIKETSSATSAGDQMSLYYGAYVTSDMPHGVYDGVTVQYVAVANPTEDKVTLRFHGNGAMFAPGLKEESANWGQEDWDRIEDEYQNNMWQYILKYPTVSNTNVVEYAGNCTKFSSGETPKISKTANVDDEGVAGDVYDTNFKAADVVSFPGAKKLKIDLQYAIEANWDYLYIFQGEYTGEMPEAGSDAGEVARYSEDRYGTMSDTLYVDGDTATFVFLSDEYEARYGYFAKVYPMYESTGGDSVKLCDYTVSSGKYDVPYVEYNASTTIGADATISDYNGRESWSAMIDGKEVTFDSEKEIIKFLHGEGYKFFQTELDLYPSMNRIMYDGNGASWGTMDGFVTEFWPNSTNEYVRLNAPNFYKEGYGFAGWSADKNASVDGGGKIYGPNELISEGEFNYGETHSATLYAVWVKSAGSLQNWNGCGAMSMGAVVALTDVRDGNVYTVGKMADGNCWMMENLRLEAENSKDATLAQGYGGVFQGLADSEKENFGTNTANSLYSSSNIIGDKLSERIPRYNHENTNVADTSLMNAPRLYNSGGVGYCTKCRWYGYGNYYNFAAANATTEEVTADNRVADGTSICPAGWSLPTHSDDNSTGGFEYLDIQLGGNGGDVQGEVGRWVKYPMNMVLAGEWLESDFSYPGGGRSNSSGWRGVFGVYLSSNKKSDGSMWVLRLGSDNGNYLGFEVSVPRGFSTRCLTR